MRWFQGCAVVVLLAGAVSDGRADPVVCRESPREQDRFICGDPGLRDMERRLLLDLKDRPYPPSEARVRCGLDASCLQRWYVRMIREARGTAGSTGAETRQ
jgi:hypothetical protein